MKFDLILASDVLYERESLPVIARLLPQLIAHTGVRGRKVIVADPMDRCPGNFQHFVELLQAEISSASFPYTQSEVEVRVEEEVRKILMDGRTTPVRVVHFFW
eukprot:TRINITY_DN16855_c0_g1_i1.p1 TRINITY_DN16855_c0_g1~~TRINITY_DN16855_c0_g1_i1.p1  ORF type:complete len:103 (+),score=18.62 TRINITY_DN16855_c0_g1_i1:1-309(+)